MNESNSDSSSQSGLFYLLVGPGGTGKNTLMHVALDRLSNLTQLATATTRPRRVGEIEGVHHLFVSNNEFRNMIRDGDLLEWQEVTPGRFYGIPRHVVDDTLESGHDLIADIEVNGARIVKEHYGDRAVLIFITVPGETTLDKLDVLRTRMLTRHPDEDPANIRARLNRAQVLELPFAREADFQIVNDDLDDASGELLDIIRNKREQHGRLIHIGSKA